MDELISTSELAKAIGVRRSDISRRARTRGIEPVRRGWQNFWTRTAIEAMRADLPRGYGSPKHPRNKGLGKIV